MPARERPGTRRKLEMLSPFTDNTTYRIQHVNAAGQQELVGHVFACPSSSPGEVDQEQHWVLYPAYFQILKAIMGGERREDAITFRIPPVEHRYTTREAWTMALRDSAAGAGALWQDGATYVGVNAVNYAEVPALIEPVPYLYSSLDGASTSA